MSGWRGGVAILRTSFERIRGNPADVLREWEDRVFGELASSDRETPAEDAFSSPVEDDSLDEREREFADPYEDASDWLEDTLRDSADDGVTGFIEDDPDEVLDRVGEYTHDITAISRAGDLLRRSRWESFDFDAAVRELREAEMPQLSMGMQHQSSRWPECWKHMRQYMFALLDASDFPEEVDPLPQPAFAPGNQRPVWSDPAVVAPPPEADLSQAFDLEATESTVAARLGAPHILPMDVLTWQRANCMIRGRADPFRDPEEDDEGHCEEALLKRWISWNETWKRTPLAQIARRLGQAVEDAYLRLAGSLQSLDDDDDAEADALYALTRFRGIAIVTVPLGILIPVFAIVAALTGWLLSEGSWLPALLVVVVWALVVGMGGAVSWKVVTTTRKFIYLVGRRWQWAMTVRHYAIELTRLHGVSRAFADHQAVVRTMLHDPFPRGGDVIGRGTAQDELELQPESLLIATAAVDEDRWQWANKTMLPKLVRAGWLERAHGAVKEVWEEGFRELLGGIEFDDPEDDYSPPGHVRFRAVETGASVHGSREDFREAIVARTDVRTEARVRTAMKLEGIGETQELELLGSITVERHPAIGGAADTFLEFGDFVPLEFDPAIARAGAGPVTVSPESSLGLNATITKLDSWGLDGSETAFVSWRLLVSEPQDPRALTGVKTHRADLGREDATGGSDERVV